jgi:RES domain-containing protein
VVEGAWNPAAALAACPTMPWSGNVWRIHKQKYPATDPGGSLKVTGRYHRGLDQFTSTDTWLALYVALNPETCMGELLRHFSPELYPLLNSYRLTELAVDLRSVADCRDPEVLGLSIADIVDDVDFSTTHRLGEAAYRSGSEGMLVPSATALGDNLVVFTTNLHPGSRIHVLSTREPRLYVQRSQV